MRRLSLLLPVALLLAACGSREARPPEAHDLSGTVSETWAEKPRLALVGIGLPDAFKNESRYEQTAVRQSDGTWTFGMDLPPVPDVLGVYQVVAFVDRDGDARFDPDEVGQAARNRQWLIFSPADMESKRVTISASSRLREYFPEWDGEVLPALRLKRGWNLYDHAAALTGDNPRPVKKEGEPGYDLSR
ncbi:hypothetical protein F8S09_10275 [Deinococcus sp. SDU3-2]|uniref:Lipoprotein n=1 Tax=Deinococcus terrestris TaxID=2651870 RepID=A0A7X1NWG8_9DEIO|nr:hypothetical protein [Deinococcus terrestris]MPY67072.1 hypothetical protein [Deinococcus terrestris]